MLDSKDILEINDYEFFSFKHEAIKPKTVNLKFKDIIPEFSSLELGEKELYEHQYKCYNALMNGKNVILKSGTGSGKTEAWLVYALEKRIPSLAVYPTLALANDQIKRIDLYSEKLKLKTLALDALRREELLKEYGRTKLSSIISELDILVTNPAFLMHELKKISKSKASLIQNFLRKFQLLVFDEIDFYSPREIALILGIVDILNMINEKGFQIVTLSAMIENPEELASFYKEVNKKDTEIIEGEKFNVENRTYVILGKNLKRFWERFKQNKERIMGEIAKSDLKAFEDYEYFKENFFKFYEICRAIKIDIGNPEFDPIQIIKHYVNDEHVTLVFTKGINSAEEIARRLINSLDQEKAKKVATHHHLIGKEERKKIEEGARKGIVKIIISPRTLSQGIDIGTVGRIVHLGLPEDLREFYQREGRKGRRSELPFSETIIIPYSSWDRKLLTRGIEAFKAWLDLPVEKIIVNPENKYRLLFEAIFKFTSPRFKKSLRDEEIKLLKELNLFKGDELSEIGKEVERKLQFYEFGMPYGIKRILEIEEAKLYLQEISHCDLVEKFQPGCFDPSNDAIVVEHKISGDMPRIVSAVIEKELRYENLIKKGEFLPVLEEYEEIKYKWGETPNLLSDYYTGRLSSEVLCVVHPPKKTFGKYFKYPNRVYWALRSTKPRVKVIADKTVVYFERSKIEVPAATYGKYSDYTYGSFYELDPSEDTEAIRIGLAFLSIVLRRKLRIPFGTIAYDVGKFGDKKFFEIHEPDSAGLIFKLDWSEIRKLVEEYVPDDLDEVLFEAVDEYTYSDFLAKNLDWGSAKRQAIKVIDYILIKEKIKAKFKDKEIIIPRPSKALRLVSIDMLWIPLKEEFGRNSGIFSVSFFNGEEFHSSSFYVEEGKVKNFEDAMSILSSYVDENYKVILFDFESKKKVFSELGLRSMSYILDSLSKEGRVEDLKLNSLERLKLDFISLEELESLSEIKRETSLSDLLFEVENSKQKINQAKGLSWKNFTKYIEEKSLKYLEENSKSIYFAYLVIQNL